MTEKRVRVFSGVQPSGVIHLGNYLGALRQWVANQDKSQSIFCVVDLHALTIPESIKPQALRIRSREVAALYFACGIDPAYSNVFIQSHIRQHSELAWILNCTTPLGWLERMTQFKSKAAGRESVGMGLLDYPVLQAADILLYDTEFVPVGADQKQHIELTRDIAIRFNKLFGDVFVLPAPLIPKSGARVMGFDEPDHKMSKSVAEERPGHAVGILDSEKRIRKTIMGAKTDSGCEFNPEHASSGVRNLITILEALTGESQAAISGRFAGQGYGYLKKEVFEAVLATLLPIQEEYHRYIDDPAQLDALLDTSTASVQRIAEATMDRVRNAVGVG
jgi:tryptophanyl-tRNA synthetase